MYPSRDARATLVDLLDRILDKGLMLDADLIVHVAGIPLLGIKLRAALAGMETMLRYGIWEDWDAAQRAIANKERFCLNNAQAVKEIEEKMKNSGLEPEGNPPLTELAR
jgi:hypothetical protein